MPKEDFKTRMTKWIKRFKNSKLVTRTDKVLIPGEKENNLGN